MKRIKIVALANDFTDKSSVKPLFLELEHYEEKQIPKEQDIFSAHSFDTLQQSAKDLVNSLWTAFNSFLKMSMWAIILVSESLRWVWKKGLGKK